jgi:hypothetical protein
MLFQEDCSNKWRFQVVSILIFNLILSGINEAGVVIKVH